MNNFEHTKNKPMEKQNNQQVLVPDKVQNPNVAEEQQTNDSGVLSNSGEMPNISLGRDVTTVVPIQSVFFLTTLIAQGSKLLRIKGLNREIRKSSVRELKKAALRVKGWLKPVEVMSAKDFITKNPSLILIDAQTSKEVKTDDLTEQDYVILDGQHRTDAHLELLTEAQKDGKEIGFDLPIVMANIPEHIEEKDYIYTLNTTGTVWNHKDRSGYINVVLANPETGMYQAQLLMEEYGIGIRYATALFQFQDGFRTKMQTQFIETGKLDSFLESTPENVKRGLDLFESFKVGFQSKPKLLKNMFALNFVIKEYTNTGDKDKDSFIEYINIFFRSLTTDEVKVLADLKSSEQRIDMLKENWEDFMEKYPKDSEYRKEVLNHKTYNEEALKQQN